MQDTSNSEAASILSVRLFKLDSNNRQLIHSAPCGIDTILIFMRMPCPTHIFLAMAIEMRSKMAWEPAKYMHHTLPLRSGYYNLVHLQLLVGCRW